MRYSLIMLIVTVAILASSVALFTRHGLLGFAFLLPHLLVVLCVLALIRRNRTVSASITAIVYVACWAATAIYGAPDAAHRYRSQIAKCFADRPLKFLDSNPRALDLGRMSAPSWCFVGDESSPCPFLVSVNFAVQDEVFGVGETGYCVWCFGLIYTIHGRHHWNSG